MGELTINSINCNGLRDINNPKAHIIAHTLKNTADIIFLLDTRLDNLTENNIEDHWEGKCQFTHNLSEPRSGIAILYKDNRCKINNKIDDPEGRYVILKVEIGKLFFQIVAIYAPASKIGQRTQFFKKISKLIEDNKQDEETLVLLGDFNTVENPMVDRQPGKTRTDTSLKALKALLRKHHLEDHWRKNNENVKQYTFKSNHNTYSRIDRVYTDRTHRSKIKRSDILPFTHSDHDMISVTIHTNTIAKKKGYWMHNNDLLENPEYITHMGEVIRDNLRYGTTQTTSTSEAWDNLKNTIKKESIRFNINKIKAGNRHHKKLKKSLSNIARKNDGAPHTIEQITNLEDQIREIESKKVNKIMLNFKSQYIEEGEKCTRFFLNLAKKRRLDTTIHELTIESNGPERLTSDQGEMLKETKTFYQELYAKEVTIPTAQETMLSKVDKTLTNQQASTCEGRFTEQEFKTALNDLETGKTPGLDGIPLEVYKIFSDDLKHLFLETTQEIKYNGNLTQTQKQASILTLPKKGDLTRLKNWRPLSILNTDYKIITKMLANRLSKVLPHIINEDQTCSIKGRVIQENLSIIRDIIDYSNNTTEQIALVSLDQMKAFDKVDWGFLKKIMKKFNFGTGFIQWVEIIQTEITSTVKVNGELSEHFSIKQGVRQGCPLSPLLYLLYAEILAISIRKNEGIEGVEIGETKFKVSQYADDTTLFLKGDESFQRLDETLAQFHLASGSQVNPDKCQGLWLGSNKYRRDTPLNYKWSSTEIKILGIYFGNQAAKDKNFILVEERILKTLQQWKYRDLSMKGRKIVVNQLAGSKLSYPSHILTCPANIISTIQEETQKFIAKYRTRKINKHMLFLPVKLGGLNLTDFNRRTKALRLGWITRYYNTPGTPKWKTLFEFFLNKIKHLRLGINIFKTYIPMRRDIFTEIPQFYTTMYHDFFDLIGPRRPIATSLEQIYDEPIFHNILMPNHETPTELIKRPSWYKDCNIDQFKTIGDICHRYRKGFHTSIELQELINHKNIQTIINRIIISMPQQWTQQIKHTEPPIGPKQDSLVTLTDEKGVKHNQLMSCQTTKTLYTFLAKKNLEKIHSEAIADNGPFYKSWERILGPINWEKTFTSMYKNHIDKKTTDIQYKTIHANIFTKYQLVISGYRVSARCDRCKTENEEYIEHIFLECTQTRQSWNLITTLINKLLGKQTKMKRKKWIITGFSSAHIPQKFKQTVEDFRTAYFKTIWKARNEAIWHNNTINEKALFIKSTGNIFTLRYNIAVKNSKINDFKLNYGEGIICKISKNEIKLI